MGLNFISIVKKIFIGKPKEDPKEKIIKNISILKSNIFSGTDLKLSINYYEWGLQELQVWEEKLRQIIKILNSINLYYEDDSNINNPYLHIYLNRQGFFGSLKNLFYKLTNLTNSEGRKVFFVEVDNFIEFENEKIKEYLEESKIFKNRMAAYNSIYFIVNDFFLRTRERYPKIEIDNYNPDNVDKLLKKMFNLDKERLEKLAFLDLALKKETKIIIDELLKRIERNLLSAREILEEFIDDNMNLN